MKKSENFYKNGNFQAVKKEYSYMFSPDVIIGTVPKDMNGVYIRNGPNPL
jgi:carotenoid cleavage dioxygenase-like enzyme